MNAYTVTTPTYAPARSAAVRPTVSGKYDAAQTTDDNRRHWANADDCSANAANSPGIRRILRKRARYEAGNNPNICGLVRRISRDLIGTGPRLQMNAGPDAKAMAAARLVEKRFAKWARAIRLARKLRVMTAQKVRDGEGFAVLVTNPKVRNPVKLDLRLIEPEQVTTPELGITDRRAVDGIKFDEWGNPVEYHVLKSHPGDSVWVGKQEYDRVPADQVIHWFHQDRAGQSRGVSELAPMLPLAAYQRRYVLATVASAEFAATISAVLESQLPVNSIAEPIDAENAYDLVPFERGGLLTTPAGMKLAQLESEQPTTTFKEFNGEILCMEGQAVNAPANVMLGNSAGYNFSSGRLDHLGYHGGLWVDRDDLRDEALDPILREWFAESVLLGEIPEGLPPLDDCEWDWHWDGFGSIDPVKDANAAAARLEAGLSTYAEEYAAEGKDWREGFAQRAAETAYAVELGLPDPHAPASAAPPATEPESEAVDAAA